MALEGFKHRVLGSIGLLKGKRKIDEDTVKDLSKSLRRALLEADFNVRQAKELTERVERGMVEEEPRPGVKLETHAMNLIYTEMVRILGPPREIKPHNQTVLMVGLYGQGKTTTTAKLADWWRRSHGAKVAVIEADVHRPGAFEQLSQMLEGTGVEVYGEPGSKIAAEIVRNGLKKVGTSDVVIIDTAGRDSLDGELKDELLEIARIANASERFLVIDAQVGQAAGPMAETFHELVGVTGTIVTKLDGTARGGGALSAVSTTGAPIVFVGEGEKIGDIEKFESDRFISRLLGMGDIKGLIDLAPEDLDEQEAMRLTKRLMSGRFTLTDMYAQMEMMSKIGTLDKVLSHLPDTMFGGMGNMGVAQDLDEQEAMRLTKRLMSGRFTLTDMYAQMEMMSKIGTLDKVLSHLPDTMFGGMGNMGVAQKRQMQANLDKYRIVMDSMTQEEKDDPLLLKSSRIRRIARGSGCKEKEVKELLTQWNRSKKMMRGFRGDRKMRRQMQSMMGIDDDLDLG